MFDMRCGNCSADGDAEPERYSDLGVLSCPDCGMPITELGIAGWMPWIEGLVQAKKQMQASGQIGTRKQSFSMSDEQINRDGLAAELVAAVILCPGRLGRYVEAAEKGGQNRGRDLPASMTGLNRPVEVKQTRYKDARKGFLLVRPPRMTPGGMRVEYLDDSIYLLVHGDHDWYTILGWTDRVGLLREGRPNPVPVRPGQRQTWGIHWSKLRPLTELSGRFTADVPMPWLRAV